MDELTELLLKQWTCFKFFLNRWFDLPLFKPFLVLRHTQTHDIFYMFFKYLFLWYIAVQVCSGAAHTVSRGAITCPIYWYTAHWYCAAARRSDRERESKKWVKEKERVGKWKTKWSDWFERGQECSDEKRGAG